MPKRMLDVALALILLIVTLPLQILTALLVRMRLGSPVIFRQPRAGRDGHTFDLIKFRTMTHQPASGALLSDEERLSALGRSLRRFRLDELPQVWLILRGHMAFVGPRPLYPQPHSTENEALFRYRHRVRPGMTGWAQVNGNTGLTEREKLALDAVYVEKAGVGFDLIILARTVWVILRGERRHETNIGEAMKRADRIDWDG